MSAHNPSNRPPPPGWVPSAPHFVSPPPSPPPIYAAEEGQAKFGLNFSDVTIRAAFVRKVFSLVTVMLLVVAVMTAIPFLHEGTMRFVQASLGLYLLAFGVFVVVYLILVCCESVRRSHPMNLVLLAIFTLSVGYMSMMITARHSVEAVLLTLIICTLCCAGVVIFATQTKHDLTKAIGVMFILTMVLFTFGIVSLFSVVYFKTTFLYTIYSLLASILVMAYLAIDIQLIMGGGAYNISPEDHVFAAIQIFLDIVNLFWHLLALFGGGEN